VDFLLRRYGPIRFLQLYTKMRPSHVDETVREVLGIDLGSLERTWRDDLSAHIDAGAAKRRSLRGTAELAACFVAEFTPSKWRRR
jgi:hypothetical protein